MNADSNAFLEYFADGPNPSFFAEPIFRVCQCARRSDVARFRAVLAGDFLIKDLQLPPS